MYFVKIQTIINIISLSVCIGMFINFYQHHFDISLSTIIFYNELNSFLPLFTFVALIDLLVNFYMLHDFKQKLKLKIKQIINFLILLWFITAVSIRITILYTIYPLYMRNFELNSYRHSNVIFIIYGILTLIGILTSLGFCIYKFIKN